MAYGYLRVAASPPSPTTAERIRCLEATAGRYGWVLGESFIDDDPAQPMIGYRRLRSATLTAAANDGPPVAVLVVSPTDLADSVDQADSLRRDFERITGVPMVITSALQPPRTTASPPMAFGPDSSGRTPRDYRVADHATAVTGAPALARRTR